jgi:hypothetical protein
LLERFAKKLDSLQRKSVSIATTCKSLSMFMLKMLTLPVPCTRAKVKKIWEQVIKDSCSDMLLMSGILKPFIHTLTSLLIKFARRWLSKERMESPHG